jgi:Polymer-forming cytoskeletal
VIHVTPDGSRFRFLSVLTLTFLGLLLSLPTVAFAGDNPTYTQFGHNINIAPDQGAGDLTCFGCSIHVRGQVAGDVTAFDGNIVLEDRAQVAGDVTTFGGDLRIDQPVKVAGDVTVFAGQLHRDPQAAVSGDVTSMGGRAWLLPMLMAPFIILGLLVAFVVWLLERLRNPSAPAAAA